MIFRLHHSKILIDCPLEGVGLPVIMCVGGVGVKTRPRFF